MPGRRGRCARTAVVVAALVAGSGPGPAWAAGTPAEATSTTRAAGGDVRHRAANGDVHHQLNAAGQHPHDHAGDQDPHGRAGRHHVGHARQARRRPCPTSFLAGAGASVRPDSPALRALVEANAAERRRLAGEIAGAEARVAGMEADLAVVQSALSAEEARVASAEVAVARARAGVDQAARLIAQLEASAAVAAEVVQVRRTPVARPPAPGHTPHDAAVAARQSLDAAVTIRQDADRTLVDAGEELEAARRVAGATSSELATRLADLTRERDALEALRRQLLAAEQATPALDDGGDVTLVPAPSALATATVPTGWLPLYGRGAATCPGLPWQVLAAVGSVGRCSSSPARGPPTAPMATATASGTSTTPTMRCTVPPATCAPVGSPRRRRYAPPCGPTTAPTGTSRWSWNWQRGTRGR